MKLLFNVQDQVHTFTATEEIARTDLAVMKVGIARFLESKPSFVVLDLSPATLMVTDSEIHSVVEELKTIALSKQIDFYVAHTDIESIRAHRNVLEIALTQKVKTLQNKVEIREKMKLEAEKLLSENDDLKNAVATQMARLQALKEKSKNDPAAQSLIAKLSPMLEKLWSEK
jgi:hypothetical protein